MHAPNKRVFAEPTKKAFVSASVAQRAGQQGERRSGLPAARVVEVPDNPSRAPSDDPQAPISKDTQDANPPFSQRQLIQCFRIGSERFGWSRRNARPGQMRNGGWLIGMGVAAAFRNNLLTKSATRVRLDNQGIVTVETDMTDIGTGSYTIVAQTAAEMMGVPLDKVVVRLGDSIFPVSCVGTRGRQAFWLVRQP